MPRAVQLYLAAIHDGTRKRKPGRKESPDASSRRSMRELWLADRVERERAAIASDPPAWRRRGESPLDQALALVSEKTGVSIRKLERYRCKFFPVRRTPKR